MEATDIKNLKVNFGKLKILGIGTLGICFLLPEGKVLKLFFNKHGIANLKTNHPDLITHFNDINSIGNETYMVPEKLLMRNGEVIGYIASYGLGRQLIHFRQGTKVNDLIEAYKPLINDTKEISSKKFTLHDVHARNILYDENLKRFCCIDLDKGNKDDECLSDEKVTQLNMRAINKCIICSLFGYNILYKNVEFYNYDLKKLHDQATLRDYMAIYDFFECLFKEIDNQDPTIGTLHHEKRRILSVYTVEDYYNRYF